MMNDLEVELIVANETIRKAEEAFKQLHNDYRIMINVIAFSYLIVLCNISIVCCY